jgi:beta-lactamase class C
MLVLELGLTAKGQQKPRGPAESSGRRSNSQPAPGPAVPDAAAGEVPVAQVVNAVVRPWMAKTQAPGVIVVVRREGKTHFFPLGMADVARRRPVTADTIFELASVTKVFTTTSLAIEVEAGRMRLKDSVAQYIPALRGGGDIRDVTLEELATHTSSLPRTPGIKEPPQGWNKQHVLQWAARWRAPYPPGTKSLYSNVALGILGFAIAEREERPLLAVWREQFLGPLGMRNTFFEIPAEARPLVAQGYGPQGKPVPHDPIGGWPGGGRLSSSGRDMAEFLTANMNETLNVPAITSAMQFAQRPFFAASEKMTQGLCWQRVQLQGQLVIDKNGGLTGTSTYIGMLPEHHTGVVVMANRGKCQATAVGRKLLMALIAREHDEATPDEE